jgi:hypothetical protein
MRINALFETKSTDMPFEDMQFSDALYLLTMMADDGKLTNHEMSIIEEMLEKLLDENEELNEGHSFDSEYDYDGKKEKVNYYDLASRSYKIRAIMRQRKFKKERDTKLQAIKQARVQKTCKNGATAQLIYPNTSTYVCRLKDVIKHRLMQRVARSY